MPKTKIMGFVKVKCDQAYQQYRQAIEARMPNLDPVLYPNGKKTTYP